MLFESQTNSFIAPPSTTRQQVGSFQVIMNDIYTFTANLADIERQTKALKTDEQKTKLRDLVDKTNKRAESIAKRLSEFQQQRFTDKEKASLNRIVAQYEDLHKQFEELREAANTATQQLSKKLREEYMKSMVINQPTTTNTLDMFDGDVDAGSTTQGQQQQQQAPMRVMLSRADASTIAVETALVNETKNQLLDLETDLNELNDCFVELNGLLKERQGTLDSIETQLKQANSNMRQGTKDLKTAKGYTFGESAKKLTKLRTVGRLIGI